MKKDKLITKEMALGALVCLLPVAAYLFVYDRLPDSMPTHFDGSGVPDGFMPKPVATFGLPLMLAVLHLVVCVGMRFDPKSANASPRLKKLLLWFIPLLSLLVNGMVQLYALGTPINISMVTSLLLGFILVVIGNYLPACKQSYTIGIRLPWTLSSSENWARTHRMGGYCFIAAGVVVLLCTLLGQPALYLAAILACVLAPMLYSFILYRRGI